VRAVFDKLELRTAWGRLEPMMTSGELTGNVSSRHRLLRHAASVVQVGPVSVISPTRQELPLVLLELAGSNTPVSVVPVWSGDPDVQASRAWLSR